MEVKIKKFVPEAVIPFKKYEKDFCYDCRAISEEEIAPNVWRYGLGLGFQINRAASEILTENTLLSIDARPRSSIWETGMVLSNCEGTVDEWFIGEVKAIFYHVLPNMPRYKIGDKVCQIKLGLTLDFTFIEVDELSETERGIGGYGSTGN